MLHLEAGQKYVCTKSRPFEERKLRWREDALQSRAENREYGIKVEIMTDDEKQ